jgi:uncharacterized membrane protein
MIERGLVFSGYLSTALMIYGLGALAWSPHAYWSTAPVYAGLLILMLTPVTRVVLACAHYLREGDRTSAALTAGILVVIAVSAWTASRR